MKLVYEFETVVDKIGRNRLTKELHANPVFIKYLSVNSPARFVYVDDVDRLMTTSMVESIHIHDNKIIICTLNNFYTLVPHIRKEEQNEKISN